MNEYLAKQPLNRQPTHPGEILREDVLPELGISVSEAARILRQSHHSVKVSGNWRLFFKFIDGDAYIVDYDNYH